MSDATDAAIHSVFSRLKAINSNVKTYVISPMDAKFILRTRLQTLFDLKYSIATEQVIHNVIVSHAIAAEKMGPGAFDLCIENTLRIFESRKLGHPMVMSAEYSQGYENVPGDNCAITCPPVDSDISWIFDRYLNIDSDLIRHVLREAISLAGFGGRIFIEKTHARPSVELIHGYTFDYVPTWQVSANFRNPHVVCIDGYVESVSELHRLLEESAEKCEPVLLFVRGMSDDVKNTLRVNYDRKTLCVLPIEVKFDLEGINIINDVSIIAGVQPISSDKGQLISSTSLEDAACVDNAIITPTKITISNVRTRFNVAQHVISLRSKLDDEKNEVLAELINKRIKAMSPNHVIVRLTNDGNYVNNAQNIDHVLRAIKALVDYGTITVNGEKMLAITAYASLAYAKRCSQLLNSLGAIISQ